MEEEWQNPSHWGLDLPSYDDALEMPKVDEDTFDVSGGVENRAYDQSSLGPPPEYEAPESSTNPAPTAPPLYQTNG